MAVASALARFAAGSPVPVFAAAGPGWRNRVEDLALDRGIEHVPSPRHATVLLVAGPIPTEHRQALDRIHDQLPHPRVTLRWGAVGEDAEAGERIDGGADPVGTIRRVDEALLTGSRPSEPDRLADEPPNPWRGKGDHGQGGEGMMGGTPYGRPMAMTGDDLRDGLALDRLVFRIGPFFPPFPPGLALDVVLQGDVIQEVEVVSGPYAQPAEDDLERRRLRRLRRVLLTLGAGALAARALRLAGAEDLVLAQTQALERRLRWSLGTPVSPLVTPHAWDQDLSAAERLRLIAELLPGMEWSRAMTTIAALDPVPTSPPGGST